MKNSSSGGKGCSPRPLGVERETFEQNFEVIFGKKGKPASDKISVLGSGSESELLEDGTLGSDPRYIRVCESVDHAAIDSALDLETVSFRLEKEVLAKLKKIAMNEGVQHGTMMRRIIKEFVSTFDEPIAMTYPSWCITPEDVLHWKHGGTEETRYQALSRGDSD